VLAASSAVTVSSLLLSLCSFCVLGESYRVGQVSVRALDVFAPQEAAQGWVYRAANALRFQTREAVIRQFLLFREGDPYNPARLEETERNLRGLPFLKSASVTGGLPHDGVVDIEVETQDAWTTEFGLSLGGKGGQTTYGFDLKDKDFLGLGKTLALSYDRGIDRITRLLQYQDPYLFGPYWFSNFTYAVNSDGRESRFRVARPFFSFVDPWSVDLFLDDLSENDRIFENGGVTSVFRKLQRRGHALYGRALAANDERARRLILGFRDEKDTFSRVRRRPTDVIPENRKFRYLVIRYAEISNDYLKRNYVNRDSRFEDFNMGRSFAAELALSPKLFGVDRASGLARFEGSQGWRLARGFLLANASYETRWDRQPKNSILSGRIFLAQQLQTSLPQTFVSRLQLDRGWNLDRDVQFFADGVTGLRAYRVHAFEGNKRVVWNLEHRVFAGREFLHLISPGLAVFFDTGMVAPAARSLSLSQFKSDLGVGLRFAISRAADNGIVRVDAAYPINRDARRRRWLLSFSSGQAF